MARRPIEKELCINLKESEFNFVPFGIIHIENIYELVRNNYPNLCDDDYFCSEHCRGGTNQPEWKHAVRSVLARLKSVNGSIRKATGRGYWEFC
jgi:hypothetical protein